MEDTQVKQLNRRWSALKQERASWYSHWSDVSRYLLPVNGRYFVSDRNKGLKRHNAIYDSTGTKALRILAAGMMSGMTSPSRPWFKLSIPDRDLMQYKPVKLWLNGVTEQIQAVYARSNVYRVLHSIYEELGAFGTASALIAEDYRNVIHLHSFTIGEYAIATDWKGDVVTLYREFDKTVGEIVTEFGLDNCSLPVKTMYQRGALDEWITLIHAIEPRSDRDLAKPDSKNMPWKSIYFEQSVSDGSVLRESGYKSFPCVAPRWATVGGDIYGVSPGMEALGDIKQLQAQQFRKSQAIDYLVNPPLQVPTGMKNREIELFPGGISYYDAASGTQGIKSAFEVNLNLQHLLLDNQDVRGRINSAFYSDIFMMISQQDQRMTATEVIERKEEKMLMLGPVIERLMNELLDPLVETTFERLLTAGLLPPPPQELQGHDLNVEYVSMLAQAQQAMSINGIDRFVASLGQIAMIKPDVLDKFDSDHWADVYSDKMSIDPELIVGGDQVALVRQQKAKQLQQMQQAAQLQQGSEILKNVGQTPTGPGTAAGDVLAAIKGKQS